MMLFLQNSIYAGEIFEVIFKNSKALKFVDDEISHNIQLYVFTDASEKVYG